MFESHWFMRKFKQCRSIINIICADGNDSVFTVVIGICTGHVVWWIGQLVCGSVISIICAGTNDSVFTVVVGIYTGRVVWWIGQLVRRAVQFASGPGFVDKTAVWWSVSRLSLSVFGLETCYRL
jgi:hypothetical protein